MSLEERLRDGLEGVRHIETATSVDVLDAVVLRGRRQRWLRRIATGGVALTAAIASIVGAPKLLERGPGNVHPAVPHGGARIISTIAGTGAATSGGDGGPATQAGIVYPVDLAFDGEGNLYILEHGYARVRKVDLSGRISTVAGPGASGEAGRLVLATSWSPTGLAVDDEGNVYLGGGDGPDIANRILRVDPSGHVTTIAGTGRPGVSGDGGPATEAGLGDVWDVAVDGHGDVYISGGRRIRKVDTSGIITTVAGAQDKGFSGDGGPATAALLDNVYGIAVDASGNIFFLDVGNHRVRRIDTDGVITTVAGPGPDKPCFFGDGLLAREARFCLPEHLWVDPRGNVYVADTYNDRIRVIGADGIVTTVAGTGVKGFSGDGGLAAEAHLALPSGVAVGPDGAVYVADSANNRIRKIVP